MEKMHRLSLAWEKSEEFRFCNHQPEHSHAFHYEVGKAYMSCSQFDISTNVLYLYIQ